MKNKLFAPLLLALLSTFNLQPSAFGQGTAFTYQGRLSNGSAPANGNYDFIFTLCDALTNGNTAAGPLTNASILVSNGLFVAVLDFGASAFPGADRWLDIGVRTNGAGAFSALSPRQRLTATPYAITAGNVTGPISGSSIVSGTITSVQLASGAVTAANIASNSITSGQLASGAAAANLGVQGQSAVPGGGMILSSNYSDGNLLNAGYVKLGRVDVGGFLEPRAGGAPPPSARTGHTAVWTGSEMIVWGGYNDSGSLNDGGRYNPAANSWTGVTTNGAPGARQSNTAVWTGSEMVIWGGVDDTGFLNDGGRYNPSANNWTAVTTNGAPSRRNGHAAVWTGTEMIVWGGYLFNGAFFYLNDGGRYNPTANSWTAVSTNGATGAHVSPTAVWTGSEMIVWGGSDSIGDLNNGGRYNPAANSWTVVTTNGAPSRRFSHTAVWTGSEMIVWGGSGDSGNLNDGGRYNPASNNWTAVSFAGAPSARSFHTAVWTGSEMLVWGGTDNSSYFNGGGRYHPSSDSWAALSTNNAPGGRYFHTAVWSGSEMIVWGGGDSLGLLGDGGRYNSMANSWTLTTTAGAPSARSGHTAVWTGSEMISWGGYILALGVDFLNDGGRYNPSANSWMAMAATGAPAARGFHTAVWTGSEMIVWGGTDFTNYFNGGGRYNPSVNSWTVVTTNGAPVGRTGHTAVWTGSEMIVWGGYRIDPSTNYLNVGLSTADVDFGDGGRYNPSANSWTVVTTNGAPAARNGHTAVWTGSEMIVCGGAFHFIRIVSQSASWAESFSSGGGRYNPTAGSWTAVPDVLGGRSDYTAVWTGSEMIIWGGANNSGALNDGGRYNPSGNIWTAISTNGAPAARSRHTAVWTGSEMIVWGGTHNATPLGDGGSYNPTLSGWTAVPASFPTPRTGHAAVWTGSEMIVWGGDSFYSGGLNDTFSYTPARVLYLYQRP